jgi:oligopeptidase B
MEQQTPLPPIARIIPNKRTIHGNIRIDNYAWLQDKTNSKTLDYIKKENAYTDEILKPTQELKKLLYDEMIGRIQETDSSVPYKRRDYFYYTRTEEGKQYGIFCRKHLDLEAPEEIVLDENELAVGTTQFVLGSRSVSPNNNFIAYTINTSGSEYYTLFIKNLLTGELLSESITGVSASLAWANDNKTLFYCKQNEAKRPYKLYRHTINTLESNDMLVYHEQDDTLFLGITRSSSGQYLFMGAGNFDSSKSWFINADTPKKAPKLLFPFVKGVQYSCEHSGDYFYIVTNEYGSNDAVGRVPVSNPTKELYEDILPHSYLVKIENIIPLKNHLIVVERTGGLEQFRCFDLRTMEQHLVQFNEQDYTLGLDHQYFEGEALRYSITSFATPTQIYDYSIPTQEHILLKQSIVRGGYDESLYECFRVYASAEDGVQIPISVIHKKGIELNGQNPLYLYGYGAYGITQTPTFSVARLSLLERGFIFALAHIRGSGYLGKEWHNQAKVLTKKIVFDDFITCAEYFIEEKYTSPDKIVISGGSAGGMLVCAAANKRPELFNIVIARVPAVDMITRLLDPSLAGTIAHYDELGNPEIEEHYQYLLSYSPYDNVKKQEYPHIFLFSGFNDPRVQYWQPTKLAAKLRAMKTNDNLVLLKTNMNAGHFGISGRYEQFQQAATEYAFIFRQLGLG